MDFEISKSLLTDITYEVNGAAIEVHKALGPGLLESVYHQCMIKELNLRRVRFQSELVIPFNYKGISVDIDLRCDFFIEGMIVVELKAVETIHPIHKAQLLTYMKLLKAPKGILINFNVDNLYKNGQKTFVNELFRSLPE